MSSAPASGAAPATPPPRALPLRHLLSVSDQTDATGRPLLEDSAPKRARKDAERRGVAMKSVRCDYADSPSRLGGRMNISAYEALRRDTAEILNGFAWLATNRTAQDPATRNTVRTYFDVTYLGLNLPLVMFHRAHAPVAAAGALEPFVASLFKASRGMFSAAVDLLNEQGPAARITEADVVAFAERRGHLARRETERVCAAPTRLIERTIAVILTGEGADAAKSGLPALVDYPMVGEFSRLQDSLSTALSTYGFLLHQLMESTGVRDPRQLFGATVLVDGRPRPFGFVSESLVEHANLVQVDLNRVLGRAGDPPPLAFDDVLRLL